MSGKSFMAKHGYPEDTPSLAWLEEKLREALNMVTNDDYDRAVWRLVDAAGLLGQASSDKTLSGFGDDTGRGFRVVQSQPQPIEVECDDLCDHESGRCSQ